jgi:hypothetical protein
MNLSSTRADQIAALTDQQALSILNSLAAETADMDTPEGAEEQKQALSAALAQYGESANLDAASAAGPEAAGAAARKLLILLSESPDIQPSLDDWLENPPVQEQAAIPLILAAPVVFSGCVAALYAVGHVKFERTPDGKWGLGYHPEVETPMDKNMKDLISTLARLMGALIPGNKAGGK